MNLSMRGTFDQLSDSALRNEVSFTFTFLVLVILINIGKFGLCSLPLNGQCSRNLAYAPLLTEVQIDQMFRWHLYFCTRILQNDLFEKKVLVSI
jgi:hypothetical protein